MTFRRHRYPADWPAIRRAIRARAEERCECAGECGDAHDRGPIGRGRHQCGAPNGARIVRDLRDPRVWWLELEAPRSEGVEARPKATRVILTVAHLNHVEDDNRPENLRAMCQRCHLQLDRADNQARRREGANAARGQLPLPTLAAMPEHRRRAP